MSGFDNPFDPKTKLNKGCSCGKHGSQEAHDKEIDQPKGEEAAIGRLVESTVMRAIFPEDATRRNFLRAVGTGTAYAALSRSASWRKSTLKRK